MKVDSGRMQTMQVYADKAAVSLSLLCTLHCLALPLLVTFLPALVAATLSDEAFHLWLILAVLPVSAYALTMGCRKHEQYGVLLVGVAGLFILGAAPLLGHDVLGQSGEKGLTVIGAFVIAASHVLNYHLCRLQQECRCSD